MRRHITALGIGLLLSFAMLLSACGSGGNASSSGEYDPDGVFVRGVDLTFQGGISFDPATIGPGWYGYVYPVTNSWLKIDENGEYVMDLAEEVTVANPTTVSVTMRPDLKFSNGETLDAQAAINSIKRTIEAQPPGLRLSELKLVNSMTIDSPTKFTIQLTEPRMALFYPLLADAETAPVSPKTISAPGNHNGDIITAGPFKLESFEPGARVRMVKNDLYWNADNVKLAGIEYRHIGDGAAGMNGLRGGTIDFVAGLNLVSESDASALGGALQGYSNRLPGTDSALFCMREGEPLGDLRVRQALNYGTDRDRVNELYTGGKSEAAVGLVPSGHRLFAEELANAYPYDVQKAKDLLSDAGYANGLNLKAVVMPNESKHFEILQAQWKEIGVDLQLTAATDLNEQWYQAKGANGEVAGVPMLRGIPGTFFRLLTSNAVSNACSYPVPALDTCAEALAALDPASDEFVAKAVECQEVAFKDSALTVNTIFILDNGGYNKSRIGDLPMQSDPLGQMQPDVTKLYMTR
ncbi:ABC transporter substrate-binding protein [Rhodococcus sp. WAY2]|uniref:ABC transporter substrate-binding protein n=1 Tax=Rhodococcus sp. WAY2 TaxID=2663121 RepID=UPI0013205697|nr:ABC transporter substrate-binding protein [Rhodococcus sp. WAY2]QHE70350.1 Oligopeptide ABC transporter, periplasmic oligopeptide-binding protein OppA [Rhodococcus sp. WAY2]